MKEFLIKLLYVVPCIFICYFSITYAKLIFSWIGGGNLFLWGLVILGCIVTCLGWLIKVEVILLIFGISKGVNEVVHKVLEEEKIKGMREKFNNIENLDVTGLEDVSERTKSDGRIEPKL